MIRVFREATPTTPLVELDDASCRLLIAGEAYPENVAAFYEPLVSEISQVVADLTTLTVDFRLAYFNTSSAKYIYDLLSLLERAMQSGLTLQVEWHYRDGIEIMKEHGEGFEDEFGIPFTYIADL